MTLPEPSPCTVLNKTRTSGDSIQLPVEEAGGYDVLVVGAGLSGVCAAVAAARLGAKTLLVESLPYIGGNATIGLPLSSFRAAQDERLIVGGIPLEIVNGLRQRGGCEVDPAQRDWLPIDCELLQLELTRLLDGAGAELLTYSPLLAVEREGRELRSAVFHNKETSLRVHARVMIDCSGDAQVAALAGLPTPMGRHRDQKTQPMTLTFTLGGVEGDRMPAWGEIVKRWEELRLQRAWRNPRSAITYPFALPGKPGHYAFNVTRIIVDKGTDNRLLSHAEKEGRYQVEEFVEEFLRPHIAGFERCYLSQIGHRIGVRETRRIAGYYELQRQDLLALTQFEDAIACNSYPVDIHSPDGGTSQCEEGSLPKGGYYTIPYRALVARDADNLLAAGRCVSASHEALSAVRVLSAAMATGEAAGTAAALCIESGLNPMELSVDRLRAALRRQGAIVE